jgi:hypothetical protein
VREHYQALIEETLARYDIAGLELDFMREPYLFSRGKEQEGRRILTEWMRCIRTLVVDASKRRGHAVMLGVRVPSSPDTALGLGLDAPAWAAEGLVDLVVATPRWSTLDFAIPLGRWRQLLGDRVTLAGGLEVNYQPHLDTPRRLVTREEATGAAIGILSGGADAVYLFNFFQNGHPRWPISDYQSMLNSLSSLEELQKLPRRHAVTFSDVTIPGESYPSPLPATGSRLSFAMQLGPTPPADWQGEVTIEIAAGHRMETAPKVSVNGVAGKPLRDESLSNGRRLATYVFPVSALAGKNRDTIQKRDTIAVIASERGPIQVQRVEVGLRPAN